eukprot:gene2511-1567_t
MSNFDFKSRIEQLTEDNAFVNVNDVLKHDGHRSDLTTSGTDLSVSFLDESNAGQPALKGLTDGALRFNLTSALADQDRAYRDWVGQLKWRRADVHRFDRVECPLDVGAALAEVERETQLLHRWKRRLIYGDSCSSAIDEYVSRCPSFEAMTAPSIERRMRNRRRLSKKKTLLSTDRSITGSALFAFCQQTIAKSKTILIRSLTQITRRRLLIPT